MNLKTRLHVIPSPKSDSNVNPKKLFNNRHNILKNSKNRLNSKYYINLNYSTHNVKKRKNAKTSIFDNKTVFNKKSFDNGKFSKFKSGSNGLDLKIKQKKRKKKVSEGKIRINTNSTLNAFRQLNNTSKGSKPNISDFQNRNRKRLSIVINKSPDFLKEKQIRIVSRDKFNLKLAKSKVSKLKKEKNVKLGKIEVKRKRNARLCSKLDKLFNAKSRSIDVGKKPLSNLADRKHNIVSEDKKNVQYIANNKPVYCSQVKRKNSNGENIDLNNLQDKEEKKSNKYYRYLFNKMNKNLNFEKLKKNLKENFSNWKKNDLAEFHSIDNLSNYYKIKKKIGKGCFGKVYLATQLLTNTSVALKVIPKINMKSKNSRAKIEKEVEILKRVSGSKHVIKLFEVFEDHESVYLVFEYLENGDLIKYFKKNPLLEEEDLKPFFKNILLGVQYLHRKSVIHRDIKLDNILLDKEMNPKLCDFGISSVKKREVPIMDTGGTPAYLAPEVVKAEGGVCFKTDVWSLGVLLYLLTFGTVPFKADDLQVLYNKIIIGKFKIPEADFASEELLNLIEKMLVVDIDERFSIEEILEDEWILSLPENIKKKEKIGKSKSKIKREGILLFLTEIGFPADFINQTVGKGLFNHAKACLDSLIIKLNCI